jgi:biopolymer transport protein ExbD
MAQIKMSKKATSIDMTAMCDVAFLLLTFFILTATAKVPEPINVDTPSSTNKKKLATENLAIVTVGGGKENVFFDLKGRELRKRTLELMGDKYKLSFTEDEKTQFALMESFGVPMESLSGLLKLSGSERNKKGTQVGIPFDSINNQLKDWIYTARQANIELNPSGDELAFAIKGDAKLQYPKIKKIMDIYQDQSINVFDLVTGLRGEDY